MSDLAFHIREFAPDCADGPEMEQRQALLKARDYAAHLRSRVVSERALEHAVAAHEMAGEYVFADVSPARLEIAVAYCRNLVHAAFLADHLDEAASAS